MDSRNHKSLVQSLVLIALFFSGAGSLLLEVIWTRVGILKFGSTTTSVTIVFSIFMAGLALGNSLSIRLIRLKFSPLLKYAFVEIFAGLFALLLGFSYAVFWTPATLPAIVYVGLMLLSTTAMGGSIPLVVDALQRERKDPAISLAYGINTLGAAIGAISAAFFWIPKYGMNKSTWISIGFLSIAILLALLALRSLNPKILSNPEVHNRKTKFSLFQILAFSSGFIGLSLEIIWTRLLSLVLGPSVYALGTMLFVFLLGMALGALISKKILQKMKAASVVSSSLLASSLALLVCGIVFGLLPYLFVMLVQVIGPRPENLRWFEMFLSMLVLFPIAILQGVLLPAMISSETQNQGESNCSAKMLAFNTLGSILGTVLTGLYLIPQFGFLNLLILFSFLFGSLSFLPLQSNFFRTEERKQKTYLHGICFILVLGLTYTLTQVWDKGILSSGVYKYAVGDALSGGAGKLILGETLYFKEGIISTVAVTKTANDLVLSVDGKADATFYGDISTQVLLAALPLSLSTSTDKTLVIGYASGVTAGVASLFEESHVTSVEIEPAVYEAASKYFKPINYGPLLPPQHQMLVADGRHFLLKSKEKFDVITSEPSNPWMSGVGPLFTKEFFELTKVHLAQGGVMCQWLPIYGMTPDVVASVIKTFLSVFPNVALFSSVEGNDYLLIGSEQKIQMNPHSMEARWKNKYLKMNLENIDIKRGLDLIGRFTAGRGGLFQLTQTSTLNTDDNGYVEYRAPWSLHLRTAEINDAIVAQHAESILPYLMKPFKTAQVQNDLKKEFIKRGKLQLAEKFAP